MIPGMMKDKMPGQGVQPWSVGDIYPLVIARIEVGASFKYWNVLNADDDMAGFASYDDAYAAAKGYLAAKAAARPVLSPFNPAAYDAEMTEDFVACLRGYPAAKAADYRDIEGPEDPATLDAVLAPIEAANRSYGNGSGVI